MYIPDTKSPNVKITMPTRSNRSHNCSTSEEWFIRVWYVADSPKQRTAVKRKKLKMKKSVAVISEYLLVRYSKMYHSPSRKTTAGIR